MYNVKAYQLVDCEETSCGYHEDTTGDGINADWLRFLIVICSDPRFDRQIVLAAASERVFWDLHFLDRPCSHTYDDSIVAKANWLNIEFWAGNSGGRLHVTSKVEYFEAFQWLYVRFLLN